MTAFFVEPLDRVGRAWIELMAAVAIQAVVIGLLALAAAWLLRRCSPSLRHGLWLIVALKLLVMPLWSLSIAWPQFMSLHRHVAAEAGQRRAGEGPIRLPPPATPGNQSAIESGPSVSTISRDVSWSWPLSWPPTVMLLWLGVIIWRIGRIGVERMRLQECLRQAETLDDPRWTGTIGNLAEQIGLQHAPARPRHELRLLAVCLWTDSAHAGFTASLARDDLKGAMAAHPAA